jgi:Aspartyl/Asparaginyl beta-hydroxylase
MRLTQPFLKLPLQFDAAALEREVRALPASAWVPHPTGFEGNEAVRLVTPGGKRTDDLEGEMAATEQLLAMPYTRQIMGEIGGVWGRSRLMGLRAGGEVPQHVDSHYYWRTHWRIHIPVITNPQVLFSCGPETVHMQPGECWLFDSFRWHRVVNGGTEQRVHLVLDTVGGGAFWNHVEAAQSGAPVRTVAPAQDAQPELQFERVNSPVVMSPWEMRVHVAFIASHAEPHPLLDPVLQRIERFVDDWAGVWAQFGDDQAGWAEYEQVLSGVKRDLIALGAPALRLRNHLQLLQVFDHIVLVIAMGGALARMGATPSGPLRAERLAS